MRLSTSVRSLLLPSELAQQHCPRAQLSPQAKGGLGEAAPLQVSGVEGFISAQRVETRSQVLSNLLLLCGGFTYINVFYHVVLFPTWVSIMKLICLEYIQTLFPGSHMSDQGLRGS